MMLVMGGLNQAHNVDVKTATMLSRVRNMSGGSTGSMESDLSRSWGSATSSFDMMKPPMNGSSTACLQPRSISESSDGSANGSQQKQQQQQQQVLNPGRYKTEMCRPFAETGHCKYGEKCQFAHGGNEMRGLPRHPKYKTELCRTFHTVGFCPYGPRCHFIHSEDESKLVEINHMKHQHAAQQAAKEMAQIHSQQQVLQAQLSALVSQVQHQITNQISVTSPTVYPQIQVGPPTSLALPSSYILGSTADSPPESPVGSLTDEVFQQSPTGNFHQIEFFPATNTSVSVALESPVTPVEGLTSVMGSLILENPTATIPSAMATAHVLQDPSPPSSPDSLCSSLDSNRGSRLPVFSKLAAERS